MVSLVPYTWHVQVVKLAIQHRTHVITTSYVSAEMQALDAQARAAGICVLNEAGLDPGIDHMSAMQVIARVRSSGGRIVHFSSCAGGLPAPDANTNPWGYKFSWSPRGVILAGRNPARYLRDGEEVKIDGPRVFQSRWPYEVEGLGLFEIYPNRDSIPYIHLYNLHGIRNMFRGTIRYRGWCDTLGSLARLGMFDDAATEWPRGATFRDFLGTLLPDGDGPLEHRLADFLEIDLDAQLMARLEWSGLLSQRALPAGPIAPLDILVQRLETLLQYRPWERDMIVLRHEFLADWGERRPQERIIAQLVDYGVPDGDSAMSRTVSLPAAIAARLLVDGELRLTGVHIPVLPEIFTPILAELDELGIRFQERTRQVLTSPFDPPA